MTQPTTQPTTTETEAPPAKAQPRVMQFVSRAKDRLSKHPKDKPFAARKFLLREVLPLIEMLYQDFETSAQATEENFAEVFAELGIGPDHLGFLNRTRVMLSGLTNLIDLISLEAGFMEKTGDGGIQATDKAPKAVLDAIGENGAILEKWYVDAELLINSLQEELDDDDDDDDDGDGDDGDGESEQAKAAAALKKAASKLPKPESKPESKPKKKAAAKKKTKSEEAKDAS